MDHSFNIDGAFTLDTDGTLYIFTTSRTLTCNGVVSRCGIATFVVVKTSKPTRSSRGGEAISSQTLAQQPCFAHSDHGAAGVQALVQQSSLMIEERGNSQTLSCVCGDTQNLCMSAGLRV